MYVISSFEQSIFLELAISALEQKGISKEKILAVPLDKRTEERKLFDTIHRADGFSLFDGAAVLATVFMTLGTIYGYIWRLGPIIWGLIGLVFGLILGFLIKLLIFKMTKQKGTDILKGKTTEVFLMIRCSDPQLEMVERILWDHHALGVAKMNRE